MHLISKHIVSVQTASIGTGKEIQDEISKVFEYDLYPKLEELLDAYALTDHVLKFEKINLKLRPITKKNWKKELVQETLNAFDEYLQSQAISKLTSETRINGLNAIERANALTQKSTKQYVQEQTDNENVILRNKKSDLQEIFISYLKTGALDQNVWVKTLNELFQSVRVEQEDYIHIARLLLSDANCLERWITNVPIAIHKALLQSFGQQKMPLQKEPYIEGWSMESDAHILNEYVTCFNWIIFCSQQINTTSAMINEHVIAFIEKRESAKQVEMLRVFKEIREREQNLFHTARQDQELEQRKNIENKHLNSQSLLSDVIESPAKKQSESPLYIANAGLVILHPFLSQFFEEVELMKNKEWLGDKAIERGVLLTQYLVTGQEKIFEDELILNKHLCGWPIKKNINTKFSISECEKKICNDLLKDVIEHWEKLKNTSVNTLRDEFIQRQGRLILEEERNELIVEHRSIDLLLDYLPWGIGMIKTPWMETELTCIWNT